MKQELSVEEARAVYAATIDGMSAVIHEDPVTVANARRVAVEACLDLAMAMAVEEMAR